MKNYTQKKSRILQNQCRIILLLFTIASSSDCFGDGVTTGGGFGSPVWTYNKKTYKKVRVTFYDPRVIQVVHEKGRFSILWEDASPELQKRFADARDGQLRMLERTPKMWLSPDKLNALWGKGVPQDRGNMKETQVMRWQSRDFIFDGTVSNNTIWTAEMRPLPFESWTPARIEKALISSYGDGWTPQVDGISWKHPKTGAEALMKNDTLIVTSKAGKASVLAGQRAAEANAPDAKRASELARVRADEAANQSAEKKVVEAAAVRRASEIQRIRDLEASQARERNGGESKSSKP